MRNLILILALFVFSLLLFSCEDIMNTDKNLRRIEIKEKSPITILPLKAGNRWTYSSQVWDVNDSLIEDKVYTIEILRDTVMFGSTWHTTDTAGTYWRINKSDGLYGLNLKDSNGITQRLLYQYPANIGDTFPGDTLTWTVVSTDTTIYVKAGMFNCYCYQRSIFENQVPMYLENIYLSPGIGVIKQEIFFRKIRSFDLIINLELISALLK